MNHWLIKSEPDVFSIHDLAKAHRKTTHWEGVRNYQARNFLPAFALASSLHETQYTRIFRS